MFTLFLMSKNEKTHHFKQLSIPEGTTKSYYKYYDLILAEIINVNFLQHTY